MSLSSLRIPGFNNNGIVTGNESPQNSNPATSSSYSSNLRAALTDTYKLVSGKIFAEETPAPKCNRATQTDIKFGVNLKALIEYNINPEANSTRNAQPAGKLPIIENQDTILKILSENSTQSDLANYSKISHDTQTLLKNYTPKNSKNNKKLEINFDEIIKYEINQKLNTARRASYIKNTVNNITKETLPYIESINIINAIFNPENFNPKELLNLRLASHFIKNTVTIPSLKLILNKIENKNSITNHLAHYIYKKTVNLDPEDSQSFFDISTMSERAKFNYFHKINAEIIKKINPEHLDLRLWKNPKLYMSPISLLITAFDTTLIDKPGIKIPVSLEYCNASSAEMNHLADILQFHITSPSNLTKLNLSGCQFQQLDYLYIIEQLGKYPSLTTLNLSKAKIDHTETPLKHRIPSEKISQALYDLKAKIPNIEITVSNGKFLQPRPSLPEQKS